MNRPLLSHHLVTNGHFPPHPPLYLSLMAPFPILVLLVFNRLRTLLQLGGGRGYAFAATLLSRLSHYLVTSLPLCFLPSISFRIRTYSQTPRFTVFRPKLSSRNPFRIRTYKNCICKLFRIRTYKKAGVGVWLTNPEFLSPNSLPVPLLSAHHAATMAGNRETSPPPRCLTLIERTSGAATATRRLDRKSCLAVQGRPGLPSRVGKAGSVRLGQCPFLGPR
jgi:hypothetical protein